MQERKNFTLIKLGLVPEDQWGKIVFYVLSRNKIFSYVWIDFYDSLLYCFCKAINPWFGHGGYESFSSVCVFFLFTKSKSCYTRFFVSCFHLTLYLENLSCVIKYPHISNSSKIF